MFVLKKTYDAVTREMGRQIVERDETLMIREATIGRLQRENARLLTEATAISGELAAMKAGRTRSNGNLIPGGPKKKAAVLAERAGSVG